MSEEHRKLADEIEAALDKYSAGYMGNGAFISKFQIVEMMQPLLADFERKVRLEEAKWWLSGNTGKPGARERIAALEKP